MLHCDITGTGSHSILLLPGALGKCLRNVLLNCELYAVCESYSVAFTKCIIPITYWYHLINNKLFIYIFVSK